MSTSQAAGEGKQPGRRPSPAPNNEYWVGYAEGRKDALQEVLKVCEHYMSEGNLRRALRKVTGQP